MLYVIIINLLTLCLTSCRADINVDDFIYWKKADIAAWHQYFPSRCLETEQLTNIMAVATVESMAKGLNRSLYGVVQFQEQESMTAQIMMQGTDAEGCLKGISPYIPNAIAEAISTYNDCTADAPANLARLNNSLATVKNDYLAAYQRAVSGIDACAKTYPNKDSMDRLIACVEFMYTNYFTAAKVAQNYVFPSPSMTYFREVCIDCASNAYTAVVGKGKNYLKMLLNCALLDPDIDQQSYADQLSQWKIYNDTLDSQISDCQNKSGQQISAVETVMINAFNVQKEALKKYLLDSRGIDYYVNSMYLNLKDYYNTVTAASLDNPGDSSCAVSAISALNNVVNTSSTKSVTCDKEIVADTKRRLYQINDTFSSVNKEMRFIGDVASLSCICLGDFFAPKTVSDCFDLMLAQFQLDYEDDGAVIEQNVNIITGYQSFFNGSDQPCGGTSLKRAFLAADITIYIMQRCLYSSSGTVYFVTTPSTFTTMSTTTPQTTTAQATTVPITTSQPTTSEVTTDQPTTSEVTTGQPTTSEVTTVSVTTDQPTTSDITTVSGTTGQPTTSNATTFPVTTGQPTTVSDISANVTSTSATVTPGQVTTVAVTPAIDYTALH